MQPYHVRVVENYTRNCLIEISFEGMGAIDVRKYFELKGFFPEKVARVAIGHISAESLQPGAYKRLEPSSVKALLSQPELAKKKIEKLVGSKEAKVKAISESALKSDAERKRKGRPSKITPRASTIVPRATTPRKGGSSPTRPRKKP